MLTVQVLALDGEVVLESLVPTCQTVAELKAAVQRRRPNAAPCWQRLLSHRELADSEVLGEIFEGFATLQLVVTPDARDLLLSRQVQSSTTEDLRLRRLGFTRRELEPGAAARQHAAAHAAEALGASCASALLQQLEVPEAAEDLLFQLREDLAAVQAELPHLKAALRQQVMRHIDAVEVPKGHYSKFMDVLSWLSPGIVPYLVSWLHLQPRPLQGPVRARVDMLRRLSDSARVRLAARVALADRGGASVARVEGLSALLHALQRDAAAAGADCTALLELREEVSSRIRELAEQGDAKVRYAADRALRR